MARRISLITGYLSYGGGERIVNMIIDELKSRGHEVYVYTLFPEWETIRESVDRLRILTHQPIMRNKLRYLKELTAILKEDRPDVLICLPLVYSELAVFAARRAGVPFITSERCDPWLIPVPGKESIHRIWRRIVYRLADGLVAQTDAVKEYFKGIAGDHTRVIHNPVIDESLPTPLPKAERREIVGVGRLDDQKNFRLLIDAFAALRPGHGYTLRIYGEGPLRRDLEKQIADLGLKDRVFLQGKVNKVVDHIAGADIFVLSSDHEGMPNALIEGMAMGLACISTDVATGGARDLIRDGENGLIVPLKDAAALTEAMQRVIDDDALRSRIRRNAPEIRNTHSRKVIIPQWIDFIDEVASRRGKRK